mmetsp:Transcript_474/g.1261  ORF Transcript_474/g.1261 Transcript_474/m.1261 type:complete len:392 (-) Transcript_474:3194-4369(-)
MKTPSERVTHSLLCLVSSNQAHTSCLPTPTLAQHIVRNHKTRQDQPSCPDHRHSPTQPTVRDIKKPGLASCNPLQQSCTAPWARRSACTALPGCFLDTAHGVSLAVEPDALSAVVQHRAQRLQVQPHALVHGRAAAQRAVAATKGRHGQRAAAAGVRGGVRVHRLQLPQPPARVLARVVHHLAQLLACRPAHRVLLRQARQHGHQLRLRRQQLLLQVHRHLLRRRRRVRQRPRPARARRGTRHSTAGSSHGHPGALLRVRVNAGAHGAVQPRALLGQRVLQDLEASQADLERGADGRLRRQPLRQEVHAAQAAGSQQVQLELRQHVILARAYVQLIQQVRRQHRRARQRACTCNSAACGPTSLYLACPASHCSSLRCLQGGAAAVCVPALG